MGDALGMCCATIMDALCMSYCTQTRLGQNMCGCCDHRCGCGWDAGKFDEADQAEDMAADQAAEDRRQRHSMMSQRATASPMAPTYSMMGSAPYAKPSTTDAPVDAPLAPRGDGNLPTQPPPAYSEQGREPTGVQRLAAQHSNPRVSVEQRPVPKRSQALDSCSHVPDGIPAQIQPSRPQVHNSGSLLAPSSVATPGFQPPPSQTQSNNPNHYYQS